MLAKAIGVIRCYIGWSVGTVRLGATVAEFEAEEGDIGQGMFGKWW